MSDHRTPTASDQLCAWPSADELHVLVDGRHYFKKLTPTQMLWLAEQFLQAGTEQMQIDLRRREEAARLT